MTKIKMESGKWKIKKKKTGFLTLNFQLSTCNFFKGQTLIETVIALAVVLILVSALISVSISSVRSATLSRNKNAASQLAYKESELVRAVRDSTYAFKWVGVGSFTNSFSTAGCATLCSVNESTIDFVSTAKTNSILVTNTTFTISLIGTSSASNVTYTVSVTWTDSLGLHTETVSSILTPWK